MNGLSEFLVESIMGEPQENVATNALFGGGFKPPTKGHLEVILQGIEQNPDIDKIYIAVGAKTRDGVTQDESIKVWEKYQKLIPIESEIIPVVSPFQFYKEYLKSSPNDKTYVFMGAREGNEGDDFDVAQRSDFIKRYSDNVIPVKVSTAGGISGTLSRKYLNTDPNRFMATLPDQLSVDDKKEVYNTLISEADNMGEAEEEKFDYNPYIESLNDHMLKIGMNISPLPEVTFVDDDADNAADILGTTAFYDPNQREVVLYTMGRHPKDVLRSYAHEMIHHIQNLENRLGEITTTDTREDDHLTDLEREAYTDGNLTFRKWTETLNEGQIKELSLSNPQQVKFWALFAHIFDILKKEPSKFKELKDTLKGESLEALYYFWDLLKRGELNERRNKLEYA